MTDQFHSFLSIINALNKHDVEYILIGGVAVILYGMQRLTRDIDLFIKPNPGNIEQFKEALHSLYDDQSIEEINLKELKKYPVIRYGTPDDYYIDIMIMLGEAISYDDLDYKI